MDIHLKNKWISPGGGNGGVGAGGGDGVDTRAGGDASPAPNNW